ncbi:PadR family transcriptional regulator [Silvibacterium sp.]|uniref:PadR family transcriptional regulator n=1 Tax=Silvibacterium sp. TaxID=1964179 RepID=UPI0039E578F0
MLGQTKDQTSLGELELLILLALVQLGDQAYGVSIARELTRYRGREMALGSIYAVLTRLEERELVLSMLGEPTPERGGRAKRYFELTREGLRELHRTRRVLTELWRKLPALDPAL